MLPSAAVSFVVMQNVFVLFYELWCQNLTESNNMIFFFCIHILTSSMFQTKAYAS